MRGHPGWEDASLEEQPDGESRQCLSGTLETRYSHQLPPEPFIPERSTAHFRSQSAPFFLPYMRYDLVKLFLRDGVQQLLQSYSLLS